MAWTDDMVEELRKGVAAGKSYGDIALMINNGRPCEEHITRNACIGKAVRMGFGGSVAQPRKTTSSRVRRTTQAKNIRGKPVKLAPVFSPEPLPLPQEYDKARKNLIELGQDDCRFPIGTGPYGFCALEAEPGTPYCLPHLGRCQPDLYMRRMAERAAKEREAAPAESASRVKEDA